MFRSKQYKKHINMEKCTKGKKKFCIYMNTYTIILLLFQLIWTQRNWENYSKTYIRDSIWCILIELSSLNCDVPTKSSSLGERQIRLQLVGNTTYSLMGIPTGLMHHVRGFLSTIKECASLGLKDKHSF